MPLFAIGYLIKYKKQMSLMSGYDSDKIADRDGLANWVGSFCFVIAVQVIAMGLMLTWLTEYKRQVGAMLCLVLLVTCVVMILGTKRFKIQESSAPSNESNDE